MTDDGWGLDDGVGFSEIVADKPRRLLPKLRMIAILAAHGREAVDIAEELELDQLYVQRALERPSVRDEIDRIQNSHLEAVRNRFSRLAVKGIEFYEQAMDGTLPASNKDKIQITRDVHNRAYGKPVERVQVESSTIRELFDILDKQQKALAGAPAPVQTSKKVIEGESRVVEDPREARSVEATSPEDQDEVTSWLSANAPHSGIGKGKVSESKR